MKALTLTLILAMASHAGASLLDGDDTPNPPTEWKKVVCEVGDANTGDHIGTFFPSTDRVFREDRNEFKAQYIGQNADGSMMINLHIALKDGTTGSVIASLSTSKEIDPPSLQASRRKVFRRLTCGFEKTVREQN